MRLNYAIASALRVALAASLLQPTLPGRSIAQAPTPDTTHVPSYRLRLLGLFDQTTGEPIEGAEIFDVGSGWSAKTTATGTVSLVFLPDGGGLVRIRKVGYAPLFTKIAISPADTAPITLLLAQVTELPAVITKDSARHFVSGNLNGFEERARLKVAGYFITDTLLRKSENRTMANLIRSQFPGVGRLLKEGAFSATTIGCDVLLDGVPASFAGAPARTGRGSVRTPPQLFNLNSIQISELQGVGFYPRGGLVPAEFGRTNGRGLPTDAVDPRGVKPSR